MELYIQLILSGLVPVALTVIFTFLKRADFYKKLPEWASQLIIGVAFGGAAVLGTELGVNINGAVINVRDAAPLCAGLIFGGPAGIIAGVIGGVERWFAVYWGAGVYSRLACSVSTIIAGIYAAVLRKYMFDNKRPTIGFCVAISLVMEVLHLSILLITHIADSEKAFEIVKTSTLPMVISTIVCVVLAVVAVTVISRSKKSEKTRVKTIAQKVQTWMLLCVTMAYLLTTVFIYVLQTNSAMENATTLLSLNIQDVKDDITDKSDTSLLEITQRIAARVDMNSNAISDLASYFGITEIDIIDENGIITHSTDQNNVGFDMKSGEQSRAFMVLTEGTDTFVQPFMQNSKSEGGEPIYRKYAGVALEKGGFVQAAYDEATFSDALSEWIQDITRNRHVGQSGYVLIADRNGIIVSDQRDRTATTLDEIGISLDGKETDMRYRQTVDGDDSFIMYTNAEDYHIIAVYPVAEALSARDSSVFVNSFMEVIVFAMLFALIYLLIKRLVVKNIRCVNDNLKQIIGGDLSVTVDVRSSSEFSSLSDDINSTVTTLKHYINEAAARIDKELEFAKNIQKSALPSEFPAFPEKGEFDIYASMTPAKEVGGDFYDFYMLGDDKLLFLVADVSGKGIPAAMFMMRAKTMIKNFAEAGYPVDEIFTRANTKLCEGNDAGMFVTSWAGILDIKTGRISYCNAGHNPPVIYRKGEGYSYLEGKHNLVLAGMDEVKYNRQELKLDEGDRIFLYTDGVTEATDAEKQLYGEDRLLKFLNENEKITGKELLIETKADLDRFAGEAEQFDDITMVTVNYFGKGNVDMIERVFPAKTEELPNAAEFIEGELERNDCGIKTAMQISIAFEEIFVNVAHYAYPDGEGEVTVGINAENGTARITISDSGTPYNPLEREDPDITLDADEREIGGLGILMVKKSMDKVKYSYENGRNIFTMEKKFIGSGEKQ